MFRNIRRKLVVVNAAVFLLVLVLLNALLYVHMRYRLYHEADEILRQSQTRVQTFRNLPELMRSDHADLQKDERTAYLFWDSQGQLIGQTPKQAFAADEAKRFGALEHTATPRSATIDQRSYRLLQFPVSSRGASSVASVTIVRNMMDTNHTLRSFQLDIAAGTVVGVVISVLAGLFLAGRALVPIQRAWEKQQRFVADASHELRTPASVIHAQTELLLRHPAHSIEQESPNIVVVLKESKRMGKLLDDLLTLARSDSNQLEIQPSVIALDTLLKELSERFRLLATTKGVDIVISLQEPLSLWGDEGRIRQLLIILLDNALKYTASSGIIEIAGRYQSGSVYIGVSDTGCGIAEEDLPHIFDRFYRGDKVRSRAEGGTGLGLSIARWIVDVHGGTIRVHSKVNSGTQVELLFPRTAKTINRHAADTEDK